MKSTYLVTVFLGLLSMSIIGGENPMIVLHAVKFAKVDAYRAFILEDDYGYIVLNDGSEESPKPRYILGCQSEGSVMHYKNKKEFLAAIVKIPTGASLREYAKCLAPLSWGLNESQLVYTDIPKIAAVRGIKFMEDSKVHCNCESSLYEPRKVEQGAAAHRESVGKAD